MKTKQILNENTQAVTDITLFDNGNLLVVQVSNHSNVLHVNKVGFTHETALKVFEALKEIFEGQE